MMIFSSFYIINLLENLKALRGRGTWLSWGSEFEPHGGCKDYLKKRKKKS